MVNAARSCVCLCSQNPLEQWFLYLEAASEASESLLKHKLLVPTPRVSDSVGLGWGLRICISIKFPGNAGVADLGDHNLRPVALKKPVSGDVPTQEFHMLA